MVAVYQASISSARIVGGQPPVIKSYAYWPGDASMGGSADTGSIGRTAAIREVIAGRFWLSGGRLSRPVHVSVTSGGPDLLLVTHDATGIYGLGTNLPLAIEDFRTALTEHLDVLERSQPLSDELHKQLEFLRGTLA